MKSSQAIEALGALAQETRLAAFRALVKAGPGGMPAGVLADRLSVSPATLSFHLKELKAAGVVEVERQGRTLLYRPRFDTMRSLLDFLTEDCCRGQCS